MTSLPVVYDDGGRAAAGFRGYTGDCVCRAVAIATGRPYQEVYDELNAFCRVNERPSRRKRRGGPSTSRTGIAKDMSRAYLAALGWHWHPTMGIGTGCQVHLAQGELPPCMVIAALTKHLVAVDNGVVRDTDLNVTRDGTRCVYGYWTPPVDAAGNVVHKPLEELSA